MKIGLVLEGGAMRGMYTAGVLDVFLDNNIKVDGIIGVSAGALFGVNYVSKQRGRVLRYNKKYINDKRYMGIHSLLTTGNIINKDFAFNKIPLKLDKFDEETFSKSNIDFYLTVTNIETGKPEYIKIKNTNEQIEYFRATSAMPFVSKIVKIDNKKYLDGAFSDSIPVSKCIELGYDKIIVVLTRPKDYKKKKTNKFIPQIRYFRYKNLINCINNRYKEYNNTLELIKDYEDKKQIFVIRPSKKINIKRIEKNINKIEEMYNLGISDANQLMSKLTEYLKQ